MGCVSYGRLNRLIYPQSEPFKPLKFLGTLIHWTDCGVTDRLIRLAAECSDGLDIARLGD